MFKKITSQNIGDLGQSLAEKTKEAAVKQTDQILNAVSTSLPKVVEKIPSNTQELKTDIDFIKSTVTAIFRDITSDEPSMSAKIRQKLNRLDPVSASIYFPLNEMTPINRLNPAELDLIKPEVLASMMNGVKVELGFQSFENFLDQTVPALSHKGFFIIYSPSSPDARIVSGHFSMIIGDTFFNRNVDESGPDALVSRKLPELKALWEGYLNQNKDLMVMAQFFELSEASSHTLLTFFHRRVWNYHAKNPLYQSRYASLPLSKNKDVLYGENCVTFCYPFLDDRWTQLEPHLKRVQTEMGEQYLSNIPMRQFFENITLNAYRGSLVISGNAEKTKETLLTRGMKNSFFGSQLQLDGPSIPLGEESIFETLWRQTKVTLLKPVDKIKTK